MDNNLNELHDAVDKLIDTATNIMSNKFRLTIMNENYEQLGIDKTIVNVSVMITSWLFRNDPNPDDKLVKATLDDISGEVCDLFNTYLTLGCNRAANDIVTTVKSDIFFNTKGVDVVTGLVDFLTDTNSSNVLDSLTSICYDTIGRTLSEMLRKYKDKEYSYKI